MEESEWERRKGSVHSPKEEEGGRSPPFGHDEFIDSIRDLTSNHPMLLFFATAQQFFFRKIEFLFIIFVSFQS